jgi:hypothetical protein
MLVELWKAEFACLVVGVVSFLAGWKFGSVIYGAQDTFNGKEEK